MVWYGLWLFVASIIALLIAVAIVFGGKKQ